MQNGTSHEASDPDFGRIVQVTEYDRPASGKDEAVTAQSIGLMQLFTVRDAANPIIIDAAHRAVIESGLPASATRREIAEQAIFPWVKRTIRYVPESQLRTPLAHTNDLVDQQLIPPVALLSMPEPIGDCPHFSMLTAALCRVWHIPSAFKTIAADPRTPDIFTHVYCIAQPEPGEFTALDTSNAPGPGLEYARPTKSKVWPIHEDTSEKTMIRHEHQNATRIQGIRRRLGELDDEGNYISGSDSGSGSNLMTGPNPTPTELATVNFQSNPATPASSASTSDWGSFLSTVANDAVKIAAPFTRQAPYYITGASGAQVLYDPNTGTVATAKTTATTDLATTVRAAASSIPSTVWVLGGLGLLAVLAFQGASGKR